MQEKRNQNLLCSSLNMNICVYWEYMPHAVNVISSRRSKEVTALYIGHWCYNRGVWCPIMQKIRGILSVKKIMGLGLINQRSCINHSREEIVSFWPYNQDTYRLKPNNRRFPQRNMTPGCTVESWLSDAPCDSWFCVVHFHGQYVAATHDHGTAQPSLPWIA